MTWGCSCSVPTDMDWKTRLISPSPASLDEGAWLFQQTTNTIQLFEGEFKTCFVRFSLILIIFIRSMGKAHQNRLPSLAEGERAAKNPRSAQVHFWFSLRAPR